MAEAADKLLFANNRTAHLAVALNIGDPALVLAAGEGADWPSPVLGEYFVLTIQNLLTGALEICHGTAREGDTISIVRGQEGTAEQAFTIDTTIVQMRVTKGILEKLIQQTFTSNDAGGYLQVQDDGTVEAVEVEIPTGPDLPPLVGFIGAAATRTVDLVVPADTLTPLPFDTELYDMRGIWHNTLPELRNRFYAPFDGFYCLLVNVYWSSDPASIGRRCIFVHKNSTLSPISGLVGMSETKDQHQQVLIHGFLQGGEYFDVYVQATNATTMKCSVQNAMATFFSTVGAEGNEGPPGPPGGVTSFVREAVFASGGALTSAAAPVSVAFHKPARIRQVVLLGDVVGSVAVDIKKTTISAYAGGSDGTTICGADKPTITASTALDKTSFNGWFLDVAAGDVLNFSLASVSAFKRVAVQVFFQEISA